MVARSILLLLLAASVAGFEYFVSREDGWGVCVSDQRKRASWRAREGNELLPLYDLRLLPKDHEEMWTDDWRVQNLEIHTFSTSTIELNHRVVTTDGSERFKRLHKGDISQEFLLQATNAIFVWSENEDWRQGWSFRVHLNQRAHPDQERYQTWADFCTENEKCQRLNVAEDNTGGADLLSRGRSWTNVELKWEKPNLDLCTGGSELLVRWTAETRRWFEPEFFFARTDATRGVFQVPLKTLVEPVEGENEKKANELSRTFSVGPEGNLCLDIYWSITVKEGDKGRFELLDSSGAVQRHGRLLLHLGDERTRLNFTLGRGGDFRLRLVDVSDPIEHIAACLGPEMKMWSPSKGCNVLAQSWADKTATATLAPSPINRRVRVDLTQEQLRRVCAALGVGPQDPALKFNAERGAARKKCPAP